MTSEVAAAGKTSPEAGANLPPGAGGPTPQEPGGVPAVDERPRFSAKPAYRETVAGFAALGAWVAFFGAGVLVSTQSYRQALRGERDISAMTWVGYVLATLCSYTVTNLFFLCCLAAFLGCMACRWQVDGPMDKNKEFFSGLSPRRMYTASVLRGFLFYTFVISGLLVMSTEKALEETTPAQYIRLGGFVSSLAFIVGYDPQLIHRFTSKLTEIGLGRREP